MSNDKWIENKNPPKSRTYQLRHDTYGVVVYVEEYQQGSFKIKIENPKQSAVDRISIGPDLTRMIHPKGQSVFPNKARAIDAAVKWSHSTDMSMLADGTPDIKNSDD